MGSLWDMLSLSFRWNIDIDIDTDLEIDTDIYMHVAIIQWDICLILWKEARIEKSYLGVINIELITEAKELLIAKEGHI